MVRGAGHSLFIIGMRSAHRLVKKYLKVFRVFTNNDIIFKYNSNTYLITLLRIDLSANTDRYFRKVFIYTTFLKLSRIGKVRLCIKYSNIYNEILLKSGYTHTPPNRRIYKGTRSAPVFKRTDWRVNIA